MKSKSVFLLIMLIFIAFISPAQNLRQKLVGIEGGVTLFGTDMSNIANVRGEIPSYSSDYSVSNITSLMHKDFFGIKGEMLFLKNKKLGVMGGIRYSRVYSSVGKSDYWGSNPNYFYWLFSQEGVNTEFLKIKDITQKSDYIGIPLEVRYFPHRPQIMRFYVKLGAEVAVLLKSRTDVKFYNEAMEQYQDAVAEVAGKPGSFFSIAYAGAGFRIGKESNPAVNIELCLPAFFITSGSMGLVNPYSNGQGGGGFQLNIQVPINSDAK